jgi:hypothetical protein
MKGGKGLRAGRFFSTIELCLPCGAGEDSMGQVFEWLATHAWVVLLAAGIFVVLAGSAAAYFLWRGLGRGAERISPPTQPRQRESSPAPVSRHEVPTVPPEKPAFAGRAPAAVQTEETAIDEEMQALLAKLETYSATLAEDEILPLARGGKISKDAIRRMIKRLEASDHEAAPSSSTDR